MKATEYMRQFYETQRPYRQLCRAAKVVDKTELKRVKAIQLANCGLKLKTANTETQRAFIHYAMARIQAHKHITEE